MELSDVLAKLWPAGDTMAMVYAIWRYVMLILGLIVLFMQPEGSTFINLLMAVFAILIFADSVELFDIIFKGQTAGLFTMIGRSLTFVIPTFVAGSTKNNKARAPAIIAAVLAVVYTFWRWYTEMI